MKLAIEALEVLPKERPERALEWLLQKGRTPGIVYGGTATPQLVELDHNALWHALKKEAFHSSVLTMQVGETESPVLLRDVLLIFLLLLLPKPYTRDRRNPHVSQRPRLG